MPAYSQSLKSKMLILNSTNHKMRCFITGRKRTSFTQFYNALVRAALGTPVAHLQDQVRRKEGCGKTGNTGQRACDGLGVLTRAEQQERRQCEKEKPLLHCLENGSDLTVSTFRKRLLET